MTTAPHLDDDAISALVDGDATADAAGHLDTCAACRARLRTFRDVAAAVGGPVAPASNDEREAAIAAALANAGARPRRNRVPLLAIAAVVLAVLIAAPLVWRASSGDDSNDFATSAREKSSALDQAASGPLPDLGPLQADTLVTVVGDQLGVRTRSAPAAAPLAGGADTGGGASAAGGEASPSAAATAGRATGENLTADAARACEPALKANGDTVFAGQGSWDGQAAVVLAYRKGDDVTVYVVNPPDCRILHFVRFRAES